MKKKVVLKTSKKELIRVLPFIEKESLQRELVQLTLYKIT